ncbi:MULTISPECIES: zinc ribbon-containing protein [Larsenimonas]|uniref:Zinc ribbon-containing protein n=1 Tax=Larsenimonas suaedae TaxID=1851019 RepID=A0ABU1GUB9_9GAMM|nr:MULTISPECIES: zinc ribbon-containing protein [Larsenimonas]MCM2970925.1 zinc ribbon-containing protein [Larsenimonas suaedae]MCM5703031.1 zinc ribbon-containing protein [Larsenimonas salina]MDR5895634.1 zinc ribbon-containing protein [Larsenimonas suaedae]
MSESERYQRLKEAYERALDRVGTREHARDTRGLEEELDEIVKFEADLERFTKDEAALLKAWLERDLKAFGSYMAEGGGGVAQWMGIDLDYLSERVRTALFSIADRTAVDQFRFEDDLEAAQADYCEGELALPGRMRCVHCDHPVTLTTSSMIEPCHACGHRYFKRARA